MSNENITTPLSTIASLVLSFISTATTKEEYVRAERVTQRAISRLPDEDTTLLPGICDAYNAAYLGATAVSARLEGDIPYALRCEGPRDRLLEYRSF